ncbi:type VII secretion protein EssB [Halobacillus fulvus]|nr:type VII secretion protein EssB [Halobacillus fulvus]
MAEARESYFRQMTGAEWHQENDTYKITYQRARVRLQDEMELNLLHDADQTLTRTFAVSDDEIEMVMEQPSHFIEFDELQDKDEYARWLFADQLIKKVEEHRFTRLNLLICPENLLIDVGMTPHFLHYGVKESIPPYEPERDRVFSELKAAVAAAVDRSESFVYYLKFQDTMKVEPEVRELLLAKDTEELKDVVGDHLRRIEKEEKQLVKETVTKWRKRRNLFRLSIVMGTSLLALVIYSFFFVQPKNTAYLASHESFLKNNPGDVIETLDGYEPGGMPFATQYQLAQSYFQRENLTEAQVEQLKGTVTLESDAKSLAYWIYIGRGENIDAIDAARSLDDRDLLMFALTMREEQVRADEEMTGEEKQQELDEIQMELEELTREIEEEAQEAEGETPPEEAPAE